MSAPTEEAVNDAIEAWHVGPGTEALHEHLGWTFEEYKAWVRDPACIPARPLKGVQTKRGKV